MGRLGPLAARGGNYGSHQPHTPTPAQPRGGHEPIPLGLGLARARCRRQLPILRCAVCSQPQPADEHRIPLPVWTAHWLAAPLGQCHLRRRRTAHPPALGREAAEQEGGRAEASCTGCRRGSLVGAVTCRPSGSTDGRERRVGAI
eukprot:scaffold5185_cov110-Isochrysis_galbana.AAC.8